MLTDYEDITSRITDKPKWHDSNGTPRYNNFHPRDVPDIYAREAMLFRIECQSCGQAFDVADQWKPWIDDLKPMSVWVEETHSWNYGDPPRHCFEDNHNCVAGDTMTSIERVVLEFWKNDREWVRVPELEGIPLDDDLDEGPLDQVQEETWATRKRNAEDFQQDTADDWDDELDAKYVPNPPPVSEKL
jgi:hypothetical protein